MGTGLLEGQYRVPQAVMDEIFEAARADIRRLLEFD